jgi:hypothetical protein
LTPAAGPYMSTYRSVVSQFASELLDAFEQKIQTETLPNYYNT